MLRLVLLRRTNVYWICSTSVIRPLKRGMAVVGNPVVDKALTTVTGGRIDSWLQKYEELVGLREVKEAQQKVIEVIIKVCLKSLSTSVVPYQGTGKMRIAECGKSRTCKMRNVACGIFRILPVAHIPHIPQFETVILLDRQSVMSIDMIIITRPTTPIGCCVFACCQRPGLISNIA